MQIPINIKEKLLIELKKRNKNIIITKKIDRYVQDLSLMSEPKSIINTYLNIVKQVNSNYQTPFAQIKLINFLTSLTNCKNILEIGTYKGFTSAYLALNTPLYTKIYTCEINDENCSQAIKLWKDLKIDNKIILQKGEALNTINELNGRIKFDLI